MSNFAPSKFTFTIPEQGSLHSNGDRAASIFYLSRATLYSCTTSSAFVTILVRSCSNFPKTYRFWAFQTAPMTATNFPNSSFFIPCTCDKISTTDVSSVSHKFASMCLTIHIAGARVHFKKCVLVILLPTAAHITYCIHPYILLANSNLTGRPLMESHHAKFFIFGGMSNFQRAVQKDLREFWLPDATPTLLIPG